MKYLLIVGLLLLQGCGIYISHGGGEYSFLGIGETAVARRCSPLAQGPSFSWGYDYSKLSESKEK